MTNKQAMVRYLKVFVPAMIGYVISCFGVAALIDKSADPTALTYALAFVPTAFVFAWVWSHMRFVLEVDEFARMVQIKSILYGLMGLMGLTTAWGFLEIYAKVPAVPIFYVLPGFYLCYGVASAFISRKYKAGCSMV